MPEAGKPDSSRLSALLPFTKYQGLGNDFVLVDARDISFDPSLSYLLKDWRAAVSRLAPLICDRNHGIGADGLILAIPLYKDDDQDIFESGSFPSRHARGKDSGGVPTLSEQYRQMVGALIDSYPQFESSQISWIYTNSDGSAASMCGNGLRCLALWARLRGGIKNDRFTIATAAGPVPIDLSRTVYRKHFAESICVDIGEPILEPEDIPVVTGGQAPESDPLARLSLNLELNGAEVKAMAVSMGNPHCVIFDDGIWNDTGKFNPLAERHELIDGPIKEAAADLARRIQTSPVFPEGVNVEFTHIVDESHVRCAVYERGCGFTLACASGAAAVVVAGVIAGKLRRQARVELPGGVLDVDWSLHTNRITITGPAQEVFSGVLALDCFDFASIVAEGKVRANCQ